MIINGLTVPCELEANLQTGGQYLGGVDLDRLGKLLKYVESPLPELYSHYDDLVRENKFWSADSVQYYLGTPSNEHFPGDINPALALIIGNAEPDSPIVLDYRTEIPRVVYLGDIGSQTYWLELCPSYKGLFQTLKQQAIE